VTLLGIVFDMDGVIIDSHPAHRRAWRTFLLTLGKDVSDASLDFILEGRKRQDILRHFLGDLSDVQLQEYGEKKDRYFEEIGDQVGPISGVVEFLERMKTLGVSSALATSASERRTRLTLDRLHLSQYFQVVVTADDVSQGKPHPAAYQIAAERLALPPERLLAIEDAVAGVKAARSAGMWCVGVGPADRANALRAAGAEHVVPDFVGLSVEWLNQLLASRELSPVRHD
jgi:beta-phosphoglucomutase